jgi:hypothetical protein
VPGNADDESPSDDRQICAFSLSTAVFPFAVADRSSLSGACPFHCGSRPRGRRVFDAKQMRDPARVVRVSPFLSSDTEYRPSFENATGFATDRGSRPPRSQNSTESSGTNSEATGSIVFIAKSLGQTSIFSRD